MYSCINQPRGCRGRVNTSGGRCESCRQLNLRSSFQPWSKFSSQSSYKRASIDFSAIEAQEELLQS